MFGDYDWLEERTLLQKKKFMAWLDSVSNLNLTVIEMGAGEAIPTIRRLSESVLCRSSSKITTLIRVNPHDQDTSVI